MGGTLPPFMQTKFLAFVGLLAASLAHAQSKCFDILGPNNGSGVSTQTICPEKQQRAEKVIAGTQAATEAALNYFLIGRPALQEARQSRQNALEGQFAPTYSLLDVLAQVPIPEQHLAAPPDVTLKRHRLGETWSDFLASAPVLAEGYEVCSKQKRPVQEKRPKKIVFNPCRAAWIMQDSSNGSVTMDCLLPSSGAKADILCRDFNGSIQFLEGKLVSLKVILPFEWAESLSALESRFGLPNGGDQDQKTLGIWSNDFYHLIAVADDEQTAVFWETADLRKSHSAEAEALKPKNVLD